MVMRYILSLIFIFSCGSFDLRADSLPLIRYKPQNKDFLQHWERSSVHEQQQDGEVAQFQTMVRHSTQAHHQYVIGTLSSMQIPKSLKFDQQEMLNSLKIGYEIEHWNYSKKGRLHLYEAQWLKGNRIVRLAIYEGDHHIKAITTLYRIGYRDVVAVEAYLIENALLRENQKTSWNPLPFEIPNIFAAKAWAQSSRPQGFSGLESILNSISPSDLGSQAPLIPGSISSTGTPLSIPSLSQMGLESHVDIDADVDVSAQLGLDNRAAGQVDRGQDQVDQALTQAQETTAMIDNQLTRTNDEIAEANIMIDRNWSESNRQAARANQTAERLTDPKHMFLLSGATAAGAVVGGFVANMAIEGLITGVDWMIEQMTGNRATELRWRQFQEARRQWESTLEQALTLEQSIDQFLLFHETLQTIRDRLPESERENLTIEGIIRHFNIEILMNQREKRAIEDMFQRETNAQCSLELAHQITELNDLTDNMSHVVSILGDHRRDNPDLNIFDDRYFCNQMDHMMRNLLDAESALQRYRLHMINGQAEWRRDLTENVEQLQDVSGRLQNSGDDILDRTIRSTQDLYSTNYDALRDRLKRECRAQGQLFTGGCVNERLQGPHAQEVRQLEAARDQAIEEARTSAERRLQRPVTVNTNIEYDRLRSYQDWFEELEDQQFCNQNPQDPRCLELAQFRHNGVFYVKNRSFDKMEDLCQPQRTTLDQIESAQEQARAADTEAVAPGNEVFEEAAKPGFFNRLFQGVADFFKSIGEFFGIGAPRQPVGEQRPVSPIPPSETYISYDQPIIADDPRAAMTFDDDVTLEREIADEFEPVETPQYEGLPASLNQRMTTTLTHPIFEDEIVGVQFTQDIVDLLGANQAELATIETLLDRVISEKDNQ
jgi:hypothetical protein